MNNLFHQNNLFQHIKQKNNKRMSKIIIRIITKTIFAMNVYIKTNKLKDIKKTFKIYKKK